MAKLAAEHPFEGHSRMNMPVREVVYTSRRRSTLAVGEWREMVCELWLARELIYQFFLRDFMAKYRETVLGYVWAVVPPLVVVATFSWLASASLFPVRPTELPYPVYLLVTTMVWQFFASGLLGTTQSLVAAGSFITKINFPRKALVIAGLGQALVEVGIRFALVLIGCGLWGVTPAWSVLLVPFSMAPLVLFTLGLGFITALLNGLARDFGQLLAFLLTFWMFLTPVVYPLPVGALSLVHRLNPISYFVVTATDLTSGAQLSQPVGYLVASGASVFLFLAGWRLFHLAETRIAERA